MIHIAIDATERDIKVTREPPFGADDGSSPIISQGTPIRPICALMSSGSAERRKLAERMIMLYCT
jgi:hypothetical protein